MTPLQIWIYRFESGEGRRYFRVALGLLALLGLTLAYDLRLYRNMSCQEAMDAAQLGRNLAQGRGYTTSFLRPFSIFLLARHAAGGHPASPPRFAVGTVSLAHPPDISNPPVYPVLLAGLMKALPFHFSLPTRPAGFWTLNGALTKYQPDFLIALFNQMLFFAVAGMTLLLARRVFDSKVAWTSALVLLGSELLWRFSVSGLSTMLLLLVFTGTAWCLARLEESAREQPGATRKVLMLAALSGLLAGAGTLTRYAFGWLIVPVLLFVLAFAGRQRVWAGVVAFAMFAAVVSPWIARNYSICGEPFGTATFAVAQLTPQYPQHRLERSLSPALPPVFAAELGAKFIGNVRELFSTELPKLGGAWVLAGFFLAGLLVRRPKPGAARLLWFLLGSLVVLACVQALGRTQLSEDSPEINSENLLVLVAPLVVIYAVSAFFALLDRLDLHPELHSAALVLFSAGACLPLLLAWLPPRPSPVPYPPYYPPYIKAACAWTRPGELIMSDIPWAVAWYGQAQCVWLTLDPQTEFFALNDYEKPVQALYLTSVSLDRRFVSQWAKSGDKKWGEFIINCLGDRNRGLPGPPADFPLQNWQMGKLWPDQLLLTFRPKAVTSDE